jgi:hypothetical protein
MPTTSFQPNTGFGDPMDRHTARSVPGSPEDLAVLLNGNETTGDSTGGVMLVSIGASSTTNKWSNASRSYVSFNTGSSLQGKVITGARLRIQIPTGLGRVGDTLSSPPPSDPQHYVILVLATSHPFQNITLTILAPPVLCKQSENGSTKTFVLDGNGMAWIKQTAGDPMTRFGFRFLNESPPWLASGSWFVTFAQRDGGASPTLEVDWESLEKILPGGGGGGGGKETESTGLTRWPRPVKKVWQRGWQLWTLKGG